MNIIQRLLGSAGGLPDKYNPQPLKRLSEQLTKHVGFQSLVECTVLVGLPNKRTLSTTDTLIVANTVKLIIYNGSNLAIVRGVDNILLLQYNSSRWILVGLIELDSETWQIVNSNNWYVILSGEFTEIYQSYQNKLLEILNSYYKTIN